MPRPPSCARPARSTARGQPASSPPRQRDGRTGCPPQPESSLRAAQRARQSVVPRSTRVQLLDGLAAPRLSDLATPPSAYSPPTPPAALILGGARPGHAQLLGA